MKKFAIFGSGLVNTKTINNKKAVFATLFWF